MGPTGLSWAAVKLYLPRKGKAPSERPLAFVFELKVQEGRPELYFLAFGERHPQRTDVRSVYVRAHARRHGRLPRRK